MGWGGGGGSECWQGGWVVRGGGWCWCWCWFGTPSRRRVAGGGGRSWGGRGGAAASAAAKCGTRVCWCAERGGGGQLVCA